MSAVSEWIAREYLESLGFLVQQPRKYQVMARAKRPDEEIDLVAVNPHARGEPPSDGLVWGSAELRRVACVLVGVRGWHTDRFSPSLLELSPEIFRFVDPDVVRQAEAILGRGPVAKVLCVPGLPASPELQEQALGLLRRRGVDGVISFRTMLLELASTLEVAKNYEKSDLLQLLRILQNYGLLNSPQLDLFRGRRRARRGAGETSEPEPGGEAAAPEAPAAGGP
jgi:hypothetical protein